MNRITRLSRRSAFKLGAGAAFAMQTCEANAKSVGCDILLCVKDRWDHPGAPKAGDAVVVRPLFSQWGELELGGPFYTCAETGRKRHVSEHPNGNHNFFRILRMLNVNPSQASVLKTAGFEQEVRHADPLPPTYRAFHIDFSKMTDTHAALREHILDDSRKVPIHVCKLSYAELKQIISPRREVFV